jgi:thiamine biosynthesis lipoprotein
MEKLVSGLMLLILFGFGCKEKSVYSNFNGFIQGTTYSVVYEYNNIEPADLKQQVETILHEFDRSLSLYVDSSILSRINRNEDVSPDNFFTEVFRKSVTLSAMTDGAFDVTVGPLVKAWGFGPDARKSFTEARRDSLMDLIGMDKVSLLNGKIIKTDPDIRLDFNAIAQGYSVDVISKFLDDKGIDNYLVEIGGEVRARGKKAGKNWRIGIDKPFDNNMSPGEKLQAVIEISDRSLATSGNYRKFYIEDGVKYSHEIDPRTGYPAKNTLLSATILADDCATADAIATACMVKGVDNTLEFLKVHPEFEAYLIYSDEAGNYKLWISENLKEYISGIDLP